MRVATIESEDPAMDAIDVFTSTIEANRQRLRLALAQGSLSIQIVFMLLDARRVLDQVGDAVSTADVRSEDDRTHLREVAEYHQRFADAMGSYRDGLADWRWSLFKVVVVPLLDALVIKAEDVVETAALGASLEFADLVKEDLKGHNASSANG